MSNENNICNVKGCKNKVGYMYITHKDECKYICQECKEKYLGGTSEGS